MNLEEIQQRLMARSIFHGETAIGGRRAVVGYEKIFRWRWAATQLNTFVIATDFGEEPVTMETIETCLAAAFDYASKNYRGWPRGFQSCLGVIMIFLSENLDEEAVRYCRELRAGKKWAGVAIPVAIDSRAGEVHAFEKNPYWGRIYYPHFRELIRELTA